MLVLGIGFLEREPRKFECRDDYTGEWKPCTKEEICNNHIEKLNYRADSDDDEYFDNWIEKFDLLCEPSIKIGFLGSLLFFGVIIGLLFVPALSDYSGRRIVFSISVILSLVA